MIGLAKILRKDARFPGGMQVKDLFVVFVGWFGDGVLSLDADRAETGPIDFGAVRNWLGGKYERTSL